MFHVQFAVAEYARTLFHAPPGGSSQYWYCLEQFRADGPNVIDVPTARGDERLGSTDETTHPVDDVTAKLLMKKLS